MVITTKTELYGILGDPIGHSLSPAIQNAAFQATRTDAVYLAFRVKKERLKEAIAGIKSLGIRGVNITIPHKVDVIQYLDLMDTQAGLIGAVNTIKNENGELVGYNTDGLGAIQALKEISKRLTQKHIVVLGAGGAAKAISYSLTHEGAHLTILNRSLEKAQAIAEAINKNLGSKIECHALNPKNLEKALSNADILINATSVGMTSKTNETPVDKKLLNPNLTVFDIVYNPLETRLLKEAKEKGAKTVDGLGMLVYQGAAAFEIWTGKKAPIEVMKKAALQKLKKEQS